MTEMTARMPEMNETEKIVFAAARKKILKYTTQWHPDNNLEHSGIQEEEAREKIGAQTVISVLNYLLSNLKPGMCRITNDGATIHSWPRSEQVNDDTLVYFPGNENLWESRNLPIPETPEDFFAMIADYNNGVMMDKHYGKKGMHRAETESLPDWIGRMVSFLEFVQTAPDLKTLTTLTVRPPQGTRMPLIHASMFTASQVGEGAVVHGERTTIRDAVDSRALAIITEESGKISTVTEFERFREKVRTFKFYKTPSREAANAILKKTFGETVMREIENASTREEIENVLDIAGKTTYGIVGEDSYLTNRELADIRKQAKNKKRDL